MHKVRFSLSFPPQDESSLLSSLLALVRKLGQLTAKESSTDADAESVASIMRGMKKGFLKRGGGRIMAEEAAMTVKREEGP